MRREFHVRFCEGPGVQSPRATRLVILDLRRGARLAGEALDHAGDLHHRRQEHLDGNRLVEAQVASREHHAHTALAEDLLDTVFAGEEAARERRISLIGVKR